ncbi:hypothetical protein ACI6Q2_14375, partial [Chitinophagaceae bacterium LWZ2-11]
KNMRLTRLFVIVLLMLSCSTLNAQVYTLGNSGVSPGWYKVGTLILEQGGDNAVLHVMGGLGYNANLNQNGEGFIHFRTSNASSNNTGFYASGSFINIGRTKLLTAVRVIQIALNTWDFYMLLPQFTGDGSTVILQSAAGTWVPAFVFATPPTGAIYLDLAEELVVQSSTAIKSSLTIGQQESSSSYGSIDRLIIQPYYHTAGPWLISSRDDATAANLDIKYGSTPLFTLNHLGSFGIGTTTPGSYKLAVEGKLGARKVVVTQAANWPDYVFDSSYNLPALAQVEQFIKDNKHLPDVPSAKEVTDRGLDVGDNQAVLLKKIEELTLYMIEQNKKMDEMKKENEEMKDQIKQSKESLNRANPGSDKIEELVLYMIEMKKENEEMKKEIQKLKQKNN